jgi:hypothetical protein
MSESKTQSAGIGDGSGNLVAATTPSGAGQFAQSAGPGSNAVAWGPMPSFFVAAPSGSATTDTDNINAAITKASSGGRVVLQPGNYSYNKQMVLDNLNGVEIVGAGRAATTLTISVTGSGSAISLLSAQNCAVRRLTLQCVPGFTGNFINCDWYKDADVAWFVAEDCIFGVNNVSSCSPRSWIRFNHTIISSVRDCGFLYGTYAVINGDGKYANANTIERCSFNYQSVIAIYTSLTSEAARYLNNTFEPLINGKVNGILQEMSSNASNWGTLIQGNWFGDGSVAGGTYITVANLWGGAIICNRCSTLPDTDVHLTVLCCQGLLISGNRFESGLHGVSFPGKAYGYGVSIIGNDFVSPRKGFIPPRINSAFISTGFQCGNNGVSNQLEIYYSPGHAGNGFAIDPKGNFLLNQNVKPTIIGSQASGAALNNLLTGLETLGLIANNTTPDAGTINSSQQSGNYTFALTDMNTVVECTDLNAATFTIPANGLVKFPVGAVIEVFQEGAGQVKIAEARGVTLLSDGSKVHTASQYATVRLRQRAINVWVLSGDLA